MNTPTILARYVDTCLSDYLQDSYSRPGQTLCLSPLGLDLASTVESLFDSIDCDAGIPDAIGDVTICQALRSALEGVDLRATDGHGNRVDDPDTGYHDDCGDEPYIYVVLEWGPLLVC